MSTYIHSLRTFWERVDTAMVNLMSLYGIRLLRISLAFVFIWFGLLKLFGLSPVEELVARTVYWVPSDIIVPVLGAWETVVRLGLLFNYALRAVLFLFWLQLAGTFLVLILQPGIAFQGGNPLLLTTEGEFVIKNLVLITAGLVVGSTVRRREDIPV